MAWKKKKCEMLWCVIGCGRVPRNKQSTHIMDFITEPMWGSLHTRWCVVLSTYASSIRCLCKCPFRNANETIIAAKQNHFTQITSLTLTNYTVSLTFSGCGQRMNHCGPGHTTASLPITRNEFSEVIVAVNWIALIFFLSRRVAAALELTGFSTYQNFHSEL